MSLTQEEIKHLALLSRLELSDEDVARFKQQLSDILDFVAQLQEIDTANVEPLHQVGKLSSIWREDVVDECEDREGLLDSAPEREGDFVKTKAIFGNGESV